MKTNELMLGDWVMFRDAPYKIATITTQDMVMVAEGEETKFYKAGSLKPIPLTIEMLLANGFTKFVDGYRRTFYNYVVDNNLMLDISDWEDEGLKVAVGGKFRGLKYVHELQHILRFIGLDEVANNFKIK